MLEIANLEVVYHSAVLALRGVSLHVPEGKIVAILGPNGAGKTTLLRAITDMLDIHSGEITKGSLTIDNRDVQSMTAGEIVKCGVAQVMEGRRIFADLSVEDNLLAGAHSRPRNEIKGALKDLYARFPVLGERRHQMGGYLSGGEQQMLAIARALISKPKLLILDEPSLGLAPKIVQEVAELVREINAQGVSILLVEQNASVALQLADHGFVLENGKIVLDGSSEELRSDPDVQEFYLGGGGSETQSYRNVKLYRRRKRWLS